MAGDGEHRDLSEHERRLLAAIEADLTGADPELARRLSTPPPRASRRLVPGLALIVVGLLFILATVSRWTWLAIFGVALAGVGIAFVLDDVASRVQQQRPPGGGAEPR